jgi:hypothetical protein
MTPESNKSTNVHVPFRLVRRGGRKEMLVPEGAQVPRKPQTALVKAPEVTLARVLEPVPGEWAEQTRHFHDPV